MVLLKPTFLAYGLNQFNLHAYCRMFSLSAEKVVPQIGLFSCTSVKGYGWVNG